MRDKLIELIDEAEEHATDICVFHDSCEDCPGRKYGNNCRDYLKADQLIANGVTIPVRCKDCKHFKPAHFKADDGTETPWDETFNWDDRSDGIYHGGKCKHDRNTGYGQKDMAFRKPDDFCSYGERKDNG